MSRKTNMRREVMKADPNWIREKTIEPEYRFPNGRVFEGDTSKRGAYVEDEEEEE
jgi:hypothetical protein